MAAPRQILNESSRAAAFGVVSYRAPQVMRVKAFKRRSGVEQPDDFHHRVYVVFRDGFVMLSQLIIFHAAYSRFHDSSFLILPRSISISSSIALIIGVLFLRRDADHGAARVFFSGAGFGF